MGRAIDRVLGGYRIPAILVALTFQLAACGLGREEPAARNLVLVSLDTLRADRLSGWGYSRDTSPHLARWGEGALVFGGAISLANETIASHHGLFQSRLPSLAVNGGLDYTLAEILRREGFRTAAFTDGGAMSEEFGFHAGFDHFDPENRGLAKSVPKALAWLDEAVSSRNRFYLFIHTFDVHAPYDPPYPYNQRYSPAYRGRVNGPRTTSILRAIRGILEYAGTRQEVALSNADRTKFSALYDGEIAKTDELLRGLLERIDAADLRDDTLVVIFSDHGEEFWDHGSVLHSHTLYQELIHVPLLIRVPGSMVEPHRIAQRVSLLDLAPTLLELLGVPAPESFRGTSLVPMMQGQPQPNRPILSEGFALGIRLQSVVSGRYKLIRRISEPDTPVELYDLDVDPRERVDLSGQAEQARRHMVKLLAQAFSNVATDTPHPLDRLGEIDGATLERLKELGYVD